MSHYLKNLRDKIIILTRQIFGDFPDRREYFWGEAEPFVRFEDIPESEKPQPCRDCKNYHGKKYNGVPFVCAMHPDGVAEFCGDKM